MRGTPGGIPQFDGGKRFIPAYAGNAWTFGRSARDRAVHPRVCGERRSGHDTGDTGDGSSPRMRGTPGLPVEMRHMPRFIPAYAGNASATGTIRPANSVHPRVCGERAVSVPAFLGTDGSSPRMRGTRRRSCASRRGGRFIPAYAGNACMCVRPVRMPSVHPRVCGERTPAGPGYQRRSMRFIPAYAGNAALNPVDESGRSVHPRVCGERSGVGVDLTYSAGSSPRMRGTPGCSNPSTTGERFIPAYAGNAAGRSKFDMNFTVHPRVCGERGGTSRSGVGPSGSSPRMRGTHVEDEVAGELRRFIPAYAGNARARAAAVLVAAVHPRVCGERTSPSCRCSRSGGSSPRMRGTLIFATVTGSIRRFIPAYAGNARSLRLRRYVGSVHPRVCGERLGRHAHPGRPSGSSPRMRGTRMAMWSFSMRRAARRGRFIPAYAGNALRPMMAVLRSSVHPRVCGERIAERRLAMCSGGSSPRMRGTRPRRPHAGRRPRFIPAYAGNAVVRLRSR